MSPERRLSRLAVASLVLGVYLPLGIHAVREQSNFLVWAWALWVHVLVVAPAAALLGGLALYRIRVRPEALRGQAVALVSIGSTLVVALWLLMYLRSIRWHF